jgi:hypothetical protein
MTMPDLFDVVSEAVENRMDLNFGLLCSIAGVDEDEMENSLGCRCEYGLLGYLEVEWGLIETDPDFL